MVDIHIHVCPRCVLRFASAVELEDHLEHEHGVVWPPAPESQPSTTGTMLVPVDVEHAPTGAVEVAATLARQAHMDLELITVSPAGLAPIAVDGYVHDRVRDAEALGAVARSHTIAGDQPAAAAIVRHTTATAPSLVCMATHARRAFGDSTWKRRDVAEDVQLQKALDLLRRGRTTAELLALAAVPAPRGGGE